MSTNKKRVLPVQELEERQECSRLHIRDGDLLLGGGEGGVEHGVEHCAANTQHELVSWDPLL